MDNTVTTNNNYTSDEPYPYRVQYKNGSTPSYKPIKLDNNFFPQFKLPYDSIPLVDLMCKLSLPSQTNRCYCTSINQICIKADASSSNNDSCRQEEPTEEKMKKNMSYLLPSKFKPIIRQDVLYFLACYY